MEISKELLSEVLGINNISSIIYNIDFPNIIEYNQYATLARGMRSTEINIYELAFRLKDWVYIQIKDRIDLYYSPVICSQYNIDISSGRSPNVRINYNNILNKNIKGDYYCRVSEPDNSGQYRTFIAETEIEAVIKACEYILKEINENK